MKNQKGFTLVEVVIASMILGMVFLAAFPLLTTGYKGIKRQQAKMEAQIIGDSEFDWIVSEIQTAKQIFLGTKEELEAVCEDMDEWEYIRPELPNGAFEMTVEVEFMEESWIYLTVALSGEDAVIYKREEMISLLNSGFYKDKTIEGNCNVICNVTEQLEVVDGVRIWCQRLEE